jgi:hypothetical protein
MYLAAHRPNVEVAVIGVFSAGRRAEDARVGHGETLQDLAYLAAVVFQGYGRSHDRTRTFFL